MYVRESEIDRENRVRIGRLSDREAGKSPIYLLLIRLIFYVVSTEGCYLLKHKI